MIINVLHLGRKLKANSLIIGIILAFTLMLSCSKENDNKEKNIKKEAITIDNLGEIHNYLLTEYTNNKLKSTSKPETFGEVYKELETILINSNKYSTTSTLKSSISEEERQKLLDIFADIKMDDNYLNEFKTRFVNYFQNIEGINEELRLKILNTANNFSPIITSDSLANNSGYSFILVYNNVYTSSNSYWEDKGILKSINMSDNQAIIWSDAAGAAVGMMCGGFMSILMGAASSNMVAEGLEMYE